MNRLAHSPRIVLLAVLLAVFLPQQPAASRSQAAQTPLAPVAPGQAPAAPAASLEPVRIPLNLFQVPEGFEITLWASTPMLHNPTNIDIDKDGRIWVAEGVRYRRNLARQPEGDRIVVLQDTDGDGKADSKHTFVQESAWSRRSACRSSTTRSSSRSRPT